jgi:long-chain acyl-CoA synthetase
MSGKFKNLPDLLNQSVAAFGDKPRFGTRAKGGGWSYMTYKEFGQKVDEFRGGLAGIGVAAGDKVAIISDNSPQWAVAAYAVYGLGACFVPMYEKQNPDDWRYIVNDSGAKVLLVNGRKIADKGAAKLVDEIEHLEQMVDLAGEGEGSYPALCAAGAATPVEAADPGWDDLCGFIYTSGTTGNPKGVLLSHGNICSNVNAVQELFPMQDDTSLSFLPWAHSFGQTLELHTLTSFGSASAIVDDVNNLIPYMAEVHPTVLFSVPRVFNKVYDKLNKQMAEATGLKKIIMNAAFENATTRRKLASEGKTSWWVETKHGWFDKKVFSKVRDRLGGKLRARARTSRSTAQLIPLSPVMG